MLFEKKGGKSGDRFIKIGNLFCAQFSCILESSEFNTTYVNKFQTVLDGQTDFEVEIIVNLFLRNLFRCLCYVISKWKMIFERRIGRDVEGKVRASIFRHLDRERKTTMHSSPHNFLRLGVRKRNHPNSK